RTLLVHNGTVGNHLEFPHQSSDVPAVDSARIAYNLSKMPGSEIEFLSKITGSYALVWWDSVINQLRIARNAERPLNYAWSDDRKYFFFASERLHLLWLLDRCDIKLEQREDEDKIPRTIWAFPTLTLHSI